MKPENVLVCLTDEEINTIARENRLKHNKNETKHLKRDRNIAELALGNAFKNMVTGEKPEEGKFMATKAIDLKKINEKLPLDYNNCEGFVPKTYAELLPGYSTFNKNKKKKLRNKHQKELEAINLKRFEEWKQKGIETNFYPKEDKEKTKEPSPVEDKKAEVIEPIQKIETDPLGSQDEQKEEK